MCLFKKLLRRAPVEVWAVQTDQGTESMAEIEQACMNKGITFYVNEPYSPTQNAFVERFNKILRDDFLSIDILPFGTREYRSASGFKPRMVVWDDIFDRTNSSMNRVV